MSCTRRRGRGWILVVLLAVAAAAYLRQRRAAGSGGGGAPTPAPGEPDFAPFTATAAPVVEPAAEPVVASAAAGSTWVAPVDGECPAGYPIKAATSGIFHVPGGRFYARTKPDRCYPDPQSAIADGYRQAKA